MVAPTLVCTPAFTQLPIQSACLVQSPVKWGPVFKHAAETVRPPPVSVFLMRSQTLNLSLSHELHANKQVASSAPSARPESATSAPELGGPPDLTAHSAPVPLPSMAQPRDPPRATSMTDLSPVRCWRIWGSRVCNGVEGPAAVHSLHEPFADVITLSGMLKTGVGLHEGF